MNYYYFYLYKFYFLPTKLYTKPENPQVMLNKFGYFYLIKCIYFSSYYLDSHEYILTN